MAGANNANSNGLAGPQATSFYGGNQGGMASRSNGFGAFGGSTNPNRTAGGLAGSD